MFSVFTLSSGKQVHIDAAGVLAVEALDSGSKIYVGSGVFQVKESAEAVIAALEEGVDDEDDD